MRGQIAFESLLILLVAITAGSLVGGIYLSTHDDTFAINAARTETLRQIGEKNENVIIEYVKLQKTPGSTTMLIKTTPKTDLNILLVQQKVGEVTKYKNIPITVQ